MWSAYLSFFSSSLVSFFHSPEHSASCYTDSKHVFRRSEKAYKDIRIRFHYGCKAFKIDAMPLKIEGCIYPGNKGLKVFYWSVWMDWTDAFRLWDEATKSGYRVCMKDIGIESLYKDWIMVRCFIIFRFQLTFEIQKKLYFLVWIIFKWMLTYRDSLLEILTW